jgi:hypothetical protein
MTALINASTSSGIVITSDTSGSLDIQSNGTTKFSVTSAGAYGTITSGTAQASTSGTSIDFTGIPSWVKRITVMFQQVSTNGSSVVLLQVGAGSIQTTGYLGSGVSVGGTNVVTGANYTTGFGLGGNNASTVLISGSVVLTQTTTNVWNCSFSLGRSDLGYAVIGGGSTGTLSGTLDRIRITTVNGTDTFDAGSINIQYEG